MNSEEKEQKVNRTNDLTNDSAENKRNVYRYRKSLKLKVKRWMPCTADKFDIIYPR